jgi:peptide/nickel transport system substrate-binding protein
MREVPRKAVRSTCVALGCSFAALTLAACGGDTGTTTGEAGAPQRGGDLRMALAAPVVSLDQYKATANEGIWADEQITEPLVHFDAKGTVQPLVASSFSASDDDTVWTFKLRPGIRFSDGSAVEPDDVKFTLQQTQKSANWGSLLADVKTITASARSNSVVIRTKQPSPALPAALALYANGIVPKDFGGKSQTAFFRAPVGTGPFMVKSFQPGATLTLQRNPHYWQEGLPYLDTVQMAGIADPNSRTAQLQGGEQDIIASPPWSQIASLKQNPATQIVTSPLARVDLFYVNAEAGPLKDKAVRQALSLALDRSVIARTTLAGLGEPAGSFLAPTVPGVSGAPAAPAQDLAEARRLVEGSSYSGETIPIMFDGSDTMSTQLVQIAQQQLQEAGLTTKLESLDYGTLTSNWAASKFSVVQSYTTSDILDPSQVLGIFLNGTEGLFTHVPTAALAKENAKAGTTVDPTQRAAAYGRVLTGIADEYGPIPIQYEPHVYGASAKVQGFTVAATGAMSLDRTHLGG